MAGIEAAGLQGRSGRLSTGDARAARGRDGAPGLEPVLRGRRFVRVEQRRKDLRFPLPERFAERLTGRKVERLDRRAKYILVHLDGGEVLAVHLGMTGRFSVSSAAGDGANGADQLGDYDATSTASDAKHDHLVFTMSGGAVVTYNDARRFGYMTLIARERARRARILRRPRRRAAGRRADAAYLAAARARQEGSTSRPC